MTLSIIIVSYNVKYYLKQCLHSVFASVCSFNFEVIIIDNASTDESIPFLRTAFPKALYPQLHFIESKINHGFGKANNIAYQRATGDYILFLNPDTIIAEDTLANCLSFARSHTDLGALGVKMLNDNGSFALESRRSTPTPWRAFCKLIGLNKLFPRSKYFGMYYLQHLDPSCSSQIDIVSGAFMLISRKGAEAVGLFDEVFFMYCEDTDLSYRFLKAGFNNYYIPTPILHYKGESSRQNSFQYVHRLYQAVLLFYKKHYKQSSFILFFPIQLAIVLLGVASLLKRKWHSFLRYMLPAKSETPFTTAFIGTHLNDFSALASLHTLNVVSDSAASTNEVLFITYDKSSYSYKEILNALEQSNHTHYLGIYYPQCKSLITSGDVFKL